MGIKPEFDLAKFRKIPLPSESEIMAGWKGNVERPVVSVLCNTYNHELYIEDAIRGFLIQKTEFPFEVVIHDDASIDRTAEIISGYARKYPKIIKPVVQEVNQYSQGKKPTLLSFPYAIGKYIAMCEGDDFWIDEKKIQTQALLLNSKPYVSMYIHNAFVLDCKNNKLSAFNKRMLPNLLSAKDIVVRRWFSPTASFFMRRALLEKGSLGFESGANGDMLILFRGSLIGKIWYSHSIMSVYRYGSAGSASEKGSYSGLIEKKKALYKYILRKRRRLLLLVIAKNFYYSLRRRAK